MFFYEKSLTKPPQCDTISVFLKGCDILTPEQIKMIAEIIGFLVMVVSVISLNCKSMSRLVILQCIANALVVCQYSIRGEISSSGVCAVGAAQTLIIYFFARKEKKVPVYLTLLFTVAALSFPIVSAVTRGSFDPVSDLLPMIASVTFNVAMVQSSSSISRILMFINATIWLILNCINPSLSLIVTYIVLDTSNIVGMVRLDRAEWKAFFVRIFGKKADTPENNEKTKKNI